MDLAAADRRLLLALGTSLLLHGALIGLRLPGTAPLQPPPVLHALLLPPATDEPVPALLHDTLEEPPAIAEPPPAPPEPLPTQAAIAPARPQSAQPPAAAAPQTAKRPTEELLYPPQAVAAGIQGEVQVQITLDAAGAVVNARIVRGSGHAVLDAAGLRAAKALGRLPGAPAGEVLLPVVFRLQ